MNKKEENYGGMMDGLTDRILGMVGFSKDHVEKIMNYIKITRPSKYVGDIKRSYNDNNS